MSVVEDKTVENFILECLKRRAISEAELAVGLGNSGHLVTGAVNRLSSEGLIERRSNNDWGLTKTAKESDAEDSSES